MRSPGATGAQLYRIEITGDAQEIVVSNDRDGDGKRDFIAWKEAPSLFSGASGLELSTLPPPPDDQFGVTFLPRGFGDVDGDGTVDLWRKRYENGAIVAWIESGRDGAELARLPEGADIAPLGDLDGNGELEFALFQPFESRFEIFTLRRIAP